VNETQRAAPGVEPPDLPRAGPASVEEVYREHRDALVRLAFLLTGSREHSEDVVVNQTSEIHRRTMRERRREPAEGITQISEIDEAWLAIQQLPSPQRMVVVLRSC
jgi:DNA-directed RNA polymerase specialized sigma24 family protein